MNTEPAATDSREEEGIASSLEALEADPANLHAWLRVATQLHDDPEASHGDRSAARLALDGVAAAFGEAGHLPMAILACLRLSLRGEERQAWARLLVLGNIYGKTSTRLDPSVSPRAPLPPRIVPSIGPAHAEAAARIPAAVLRARAVSALRKAAAQALADQQMAAVLRRQLHEPVPVVPLFSSLMPDSFVKLARQLSEKDLPAGDHIFSAAEDGDRLYILARGTVRIVLGHLPEGRPGGTVLARLRAGTFFGEMALLTTTRRLAHAIAETPVLLLGIGKDRLEQLSAEDESIAQVLAEHARRRLLQDVLLTSTLFRGLSPRDRERIVERFRFRRHEAGEVLIKDGQQGNELFIVLSGRAEVARRQAPGSAVLYPVATLGMGDVIGEISLLTRRPTNALVHAIEPVAVMVLRREDFEAVVAEVPGVRERLAQLAAQRLREAEDQPAARLPHDLPIDEDGEEAEPLV